MTGHPVTISRDVFARADIRRRVESADGRTCRECGNVRPNGRLFRYFVATDGGSVYWSVGLGGNIRPERLDVFCSVGCWRSFNA